jgi:hypothetical protein
MLSVIVLYIVRPSVFMLSLFMMIVVAPLCCALFQEHAKDIRTRLWTKKSEQTQNQWPVL